MKDRDISEDKHRWSPAWGEAKGQTAPDCPFCNQPVRKDTAERRPYFATYGNTPPWNAYWNGICDACGHKFEKVHETHPIYAYSPRKVIFRPSIAPCKTFCDTADIYSGVEIIVEDEFYWQDSTQTGRFTLTMDEVEALFASLKSDELSICYQQYSWDEDHT